MLGDQSALRERSGEEHVVGGKADVGAQCRDHAAARDRAVKAGNHRLADAHEVGIATDVLELAPEIGSLAGGDRLEEFRIIRRVDRAGGTNAAGLEPLPVGTGTEGAASTGDDDHAHRSIVRRLQHRLRNAVGQGEVGGVQPLRTVQHHGRDAILDGVENLVLGNVEVDGSDGLLRAFAGHDADPCLY